MRWLTRGSGRIWLALQLMLHLARFAEGALFIFSDYRGDALWIETYAEFTENLRLRAAAITFLWHLPVEFALAAYVCRSRVLNLFHGDRLRDIRLSPVRYSAFWPALLTAPILVTVLWDLMRFADDFALRLVWFLRICLPRISSYPLSEASTELTVLAATPPVDLLASILGSVLMPVFAAWALLGRPSGIVRTTLVMSIPLFCTIVLIVLSMILLTVISIASGGPDPTEGPYFDIIMTLGIALFTLIMIRFCYGRLTDPRRWEKVLSRAGA